MSGTRGVSGATIAAVGLLLVCLWPATLAIRPRQAAFDTSMLADQYLGRSYSTIEETSLGEDLCLMVTQRNGNRFQGRLIAGGGEFDAALTGTLSRAGRLAGRAQMSDADTVVTANVTAQLSASGVAVIGSYIVNSRAAGKRSSDRGTFWMERVP